MKLFRLLYFVVLFGTLVSAQENQAELNAYNVLQRVIGSENSKIFELKLISDVKSQNEYYKLLKTNSNKIRVESNTIVGLCRGAYDYLKKYCNSIVQWSGKKITIPDEIPFADFKKETVFNYRYYFNVVTHGYTTPYWNWERWEKEIDWMAIHGINMPLVPGAHEAILYRVFKKIGLKHNEAIKYFSGPAHFPWNRMGNLAGWDGEFPDSYFTKQIELTHKMLNRFRSLGMKPIVHAFAGFVPGDIQKIFPKAKILELGWGGGLPLKYNAHILAPDDKLFHLIGKTYIEEWEKEFGKNEYYLADSFNEMDVPLSSDYSESLKELSEYGIAVYNSIKAANPEATWVMQGWTFPYHKDENRKLFWTPERLHSLISKVPDDKLLILDLANEYNYDFWKINPSWKMYDAFFGKKWIYSFIPNMGGKVPLNGKLDLYAKIPFDAINYEKKGKLVGFGFAPEGIENNEIIYELLSDIAWEKNKVDLPEWIRDYSIQRYGSYPENLVAAFKYLQKSVLGSFTDHPINRYQLRPYKNPEGVENHATVHSSVEFKLAVEHFLNHNAELKESKLYIYDAIELVSQFLGLVADKKLLLYLEKNDQKEFDDAIDILLYIDRLLASHPNYRLKPWIDFASSWGDTNEEKKYYEMNAKRILTTWGGDPVNDYAGRTWSGLIRDYYVPRWQVQQKNSEVDIRKWEEEWISNYKSSPIEPFEDPLNAAKKIFYLHKEFLYK